MEHGHGCIHCALGCRWAVGGVSHAGVKFNVRMGGNRCTVFEQSFIIIEDDAGKDPTPSFGRSEVARRDKDGGAMVVAVVFLQVGTELVESCVWQFAVPSKADIEI